MDSPMVGIAARLVRFTAELTCLLCGRSLGTLDGGSSWPPRGEALLYRPGVDQPMPITGWWRLRCTTCGGALMASEVTSHAVRPEAAVDWTPVGVPRGRPPNWLVAERAAAEVTQSTSYKDS
jgi:ribosomal protein S27E